MILPLLAETTLQLLHVPRDLGRRQFQGLVGCR